MGAKYCSKDPNHFSTIDLEEYQFCVLCGAKLVKKDGCPKCGFDVTPSAKYCVHCGKGLKKKR